MTDADTTGADDAALVAALDWYHTIDLGHGLTTPGIYDHRPYLERYRIPADLSGKRVLDIGAASGFFAFEFERRGATVVALDLPTWFDHDFGPTYQPDQSEASGQRYLHEPFEVARRILGSRVERRELNIYDVSPASVGAFDLVFCGSLLIHLTDPIRALWNIASVTRETAIIATVIAREHEGEPVALLTGQNHGDTWWAPTRACLELMAALAGFAAVEWIDAFRLDQSDGAPGPWHGVLHAHKSAATAGPGAVARDAILARRPAPLPDDPATLRAALAARDREIARLQSLVHGYESGRVMRLLRRLRREGTGNREQGTEVGRQTQR